MNELALVDWLQKRIAGAPDVLLGPGDDCALVDPQGAGALAITTDTLLEGAHFRPDDDPRAVGEKALAASLSDLAAMGCRPRWCVAGVGCRRGAAADWAERFADGVLACAARHGIALVGGDVTLGDGPVSITVTAVGSPFPGGPVRRAGARAGDVLAVTGRLGGSLAGRHLSFTPRLRESEHLCAAGAVHAMMDLSDGLALDLRRLCRASGVGAVVEAAALPVHDDARTAADGRSPALHALTDGEDFELLCAVAADRWTELAAGWPFAEVPFTAVGRCVPVAEGLALMGADGSRTDWPEGGYVHDDA